ncbi:peptidase required for the maturation and secretion of the antibiotic peptide MccB17 [Candidatus Methylobacter favarea]|uniref:Peptidase required for the maturation and secretion of the antibiotic peptide MccB17 n=1 Tax=Candidatus Methylobacter favarea TaxID=2707345 RepID=A0A8S0X986_9GAMM|nr:metalloprotease PmbA [Candidatus Methylobacter favarea]CAA9891976.1 peptidase required for the maturation and secretion of the antibiotic peptide MccB17 [Candidatus Methylobacter favarea]
MQNQQEIERLKNTIQELLDEAVKQGASAAEAGLSQENGLSVSARMGDVETIEHHCDQGLGISVYFGQRKGSASTTDLSPASIKETVSAACSIARYTSADEYAGLPDKDLLATELPDLELYHPWTISADEAIALAIECEDAARSFHPEISNSEGASVNTHQGIRVMGNTLGFLHGYASTRHSLSCSVLARRGDSMQRDYWYSVARDALNLEPAVEVGKKSAQRALRRLEARSLSTRQCPVLYSAEIASGLLGSFIGAISGGNLYRKSSFLLDALGTQVFPEFIHIYEQPYLKGALGSAAYDGEGIVTRARDIVSDGILQSYVLSTYSARKLGMQSTGNAGGVHNLTITPGKLDYQGMLKALNTGLLVTELMGQGVNMVTGDYSRGAAGFWVENGEIQYPVEEITIAGNLKNMFKGIIAVGNDVDYRGNIRTGSILVERMSIAGE